MSAVVSPAVLATAVMNLHNWTYLQTANVLFGYYVSEKLEVCGRLIESELEMPVTKLVVVLPCAACSPAVELATSATVFVCCLHMLEDDARSLLPPGSVCIIHHRAARQGPFWVWMATLAGAMYAGYGLEW